VRLPLYLSLSLCLCPGCYLSACLPLGRPSARPSVRPAVRPSARPPAVRLSARPLPALASLSQAHARNNNPLSQKFPHTIPWTMEGIPENSPFWAPGITNPGVNPGDLRGGPGKAMANGRKAGFWGLKLAGRGLKSRVLFWPGRFGRPQGPPAKGFLLHSGGSPLVRGVFPLRKKRPRATKFPRWEAGHIFSHRFFNPGQKKIPALWGPPLCGPAAEKRSFGARGGAPPRLKRGGVIPPGGAPIIGHTRSGGACGEATARRKPPSAGDVLLFTDVIGV